MHGFCAEIFYSKQTFKLRGHGNNFNVMATKKTKYVAIANKCFSAPPFFSNQNLMLQVRKHEKTHIPRHLE